MQLKVIKRLLDAGVSLQAARKAIDCLRSAGDDLASANLVIDDRGSVLAYSGEEIIDLLQGGQTVLNIVPLGGVVSELAAAITDLGLEAPRVTGTSTRRHRRPRPRPRSGRPAPSAGGGPARDPARPTAPESTGPESTAPELGPARA